MNLFDIDQQFNILPFDGEVYYFGSIVDSRLAGKLYAELLTTTDWKHDELIIYGKHITTKRKAAWYGDKPYLYSYSKQTRIALPWTETLHQLKKLVEEKAQIRFNSCLLNLYHNGNEGMGWHSDDEAELGDRAIIASLSFGAERKFSFKHKLSKKTASLILDSGSLLIMKGDTQLHWQHSLPKTTKVRDPRINLTFRTIVSDDC